MRQIEREPIFIERGEGSELVGSMPAAPSSTSTITFCARPLRRKTSMHWLPATRSSHRGKGVDPS